MKKSEPIPKWYKFKLLNQQKNEIISKLMLEYEKGLKHSTKNWKPTDEEVNKYHKTLNKLSIKKLQIVLNQENVKLKIGWSDTLKKGLKRKHACLITVIQDNQTTDQFIVHSINRTFTKDKSKYLLDMNKAMLDIDYRMPRLYYYQNNPYPIKFKKNMLPEGEPDGQLLNDTLHFEYLKALANAVKISKVINLSLVFSILGFAASVGTLIICVKGFKII